MYVEDREDVYKILVPATDAKDAESSGVRRVPEDRLKAVKCMEFLARQVNDEEIFDLWLSAGVADGDIYYGDLTGSEIDDYYLDDKHFKELIHIFLLLMAKARRSGGLYIDGVVSE